ncbi:hypothetical protein COLO4_04447 [Corchorus olitorius]|uniref:Uncharacterized protein n=1 Tax=Corchorus olitorius TaxID=93759 RepID=A0A1R3KU14_9ROSI|nr:hypothetical protein COLO4_04457 [Corchorus olitorius]OMP10547.1 hypothetical protein COLO4_04447 [Corchorus olitorius]
MLGFTRVFLDVLALIRRRALRSWLLNRCVALSLVLAWFPAAGRVSALLTDYFTGEKTTMPQAMYKREKDVHLTTSAVKIGYKHLWNSKFNFWMLKQPHLLVLRSRILHSSSVIENTKEAECALAAPAILSPGSPSISELYSHASSSEPY